MANKLKSFGTYGISNRVWILSSSCFVLFYFFFFEVLWVLRFHVANFFMPKVNFKIGLLAFVSHDILIQTHQMKNKLGMGLKVWGMSHFALDEGKTHVRMATWCSCMVEWLTFWKRNNSRNVHFIVLNW